jgi:opacity protein-like surface antigen
VVGGDFRYDLTRRWFVTTRDLVGGFGAASKIMVDVFGGAGYRFTDSWSATLGYRYLHEEYDQNGFKLNLDLQGALLGISFRF